MAVNSPPASLLIYIDSPNVRNISRNYHATPTESLDCDGYANKNLLDICTTTTKYLFSTLETCFMSYRSISSTSDGQSSRTGILTTRCLHARFLRMHPQEST